MDNELLIATIPLLVFDLYGKTQFLAIILLNLFYSIVYILIYLIVKKNSKNNND